VIPSELSVIVALSCKATHLGDLGCSALSPGLLSQWDLGDPGACLAGGLFVRRKPTLVTYLRLLIFYPGSPNQEWAIWEMRRAILATPLGDHPASSLRPVDLAMLLRLYGASRGDDHGILERTRIPIRG